MRRHRDEESVFQGFTDLLMNIVGVFILMAFLSLLLPHQKAKTEDGLKPKAEYLLILTWDDKRDVDLDLWMKHGHCVLMFRTKECPLMNIDRDSLGFKSNTQIVDHKEITSPNQEVISIRGTVPGDYLAAVNYFGGKNEVTGQVYRPKKPDPEAGIDYTVELFKVNPVLTVVKKVNLHFDRMGASENVIAWHVNDDGSVDLKDTPPEGLIGEFLHDSVAVGAAAGAQGAMP